MTELQVIAHHTMRAGKEEEVLASLAELIEVARKEPGNLRFDAYRSIEDPRSYVLLERYTSRTAFAEHRATPHFRRLLLGDIVPNLQQRNIEQYDVPSEALGCQAQ
jgi:quinol monooxygenase YgiN